MLRITYNALGTKLTGTLQICDGYKRSNAKVRAFRKKNYMRVSKPGERVFVDTTGPFPESLIRNRYCISVVDNYSHYSWSFFTKIKSQLPNEMEEFFKKMTARGAPLKYIRCDNSGEQQSKFQNACEKEKVTLE